MVIVILLTIEVFVMNLVMSEDIILELAIILNVIFWKTNKKYLILYCKISNIILNRNQLIIIKNNSNI